jgi:hypothetical protein
MKYKTMAEAWDACERVDWLFWGLEQTDFYKAQSMKLRKYTLRIMRETPLHDEGKLWDDLDKECRAALKTAERFLGGCATVEEVVHKRNYIDDNCDSFRIHSIVAAKNALDCIIEGNIFYAYCVIDNITEYVFEKYRSQKADNCANAFLSKTLKEMVSNPFIKTEGGAA